MPEISIIVPVYNVENYLEKCVQSILQQTFQDFELILVDDGSTDSSGKLCDYLKDTDPRIHVIHQPNGGLSSARNSGLDIALGDYIGFVDSDDYIAPDMYEFLLNNIKKENADISSCRYNTCYKTHIVSPAGKFYVIFHDAESALRATLKRQILNVPVWSRLYKKEIFSSTRFSEGINYEDFYFLTDLFQNDLKIVSCSEVKYFYNIRNDSITKTNSIKNITDRINAYKKVSVFIQHNYPILNNLIFAELSSAYLLGYTKLLNVSYNEKKEVIQELLHYLTENKQSILRCCELSFKKKCIFFLFYYNRHLYDILVKLRYWFRKKLRSL